MEKAFSTNCDPDQLKFSLSAFKPVISSLSNRKLRVLSGCEIFFQKLSISRGSTAFGAVPNITKSVHK
jgi:hypothetical protein